VNKRLQRVCRIATWLAWTAFACRALTPLGYMPAAIGEGGPFMLCPSGSQAELVQFFDSRRDHAHHGGHYHGAGDANHEQHRDGSECPIGASFAAAIPITLLDLDTPATLVTPPALPADTPVAAAPVARYHARAPPSRRSA
jgi:hypothetical protein